MLLLLLPASLLVRMELSPMSIIAIYLECYLARLLDNKNKNNMRLHSQSGDVAFVVV